MACKKCMDFWTALVVIAIIGLLAASLKPTEAA